MNEMIEIQGLPPRLGLPHSTRTSVLGKGLEGKVVVWATWTRWAQGQRRRHAYSRDCGAVMDRSASLPDRRRPVSLTILTIGRIG